MPEFCKMSVGTSTMHSRSSPMPDSIATSLSANPDANETISSITAALQDKFTNSNAKNQLLMLPDLVAAGSSGVEVLINWLGTEDLAQPTVVAGAVYQALYQSEIAGARDYLDRQFPTGIIALNSAANIDYTRLQQLLAQQEFQAADKLTTEKLCELAGAGAVSRKWIYFTEVEQLQIGRAHV